MVAPFRCGYFIIYMVELMEIIHEIINSGLTWATGLSIFLGWHKWREGKQKKVAYERMERKIDAIMQKEGVTWSGQPNESEKGQRSFKQRYQLYSAGTLRIYERSVKKVKISKAWLSGVIAYLLGQLAIKYGFTFNDAMADTVADFFITLVIPMVIAFMNRTKKEATHEFTIQPGSNK